MEMQRNSRNSFSMFLEKFKIIETVRTNRIYIV